MEIIVNGEERSVPEGYTAAQLLAAMELGDRRIAVEVNEQIVPRSEHLSHLLRAGDRVEIVQAIGGG